MVKAIYFDMDGTIADLYGVDGWLENLIAEQTKPYRMAKSLIDMRKLGKVLNHLQSLGFGGFQLIVHDDDIKLRCKGQFVGSLGHPAFDHFGCIRGPTDQPTT